MALLTIGPPTMAPLTIHSVHAVHISTKVVVVDHGSPSKRVNAVRSRLRDEVAAEIESELGARAVSAVSLIGLAPGWELQLVVVACVPHRRTAAPPQSGSCDGFLGWALPWAPCPHTYDVCMCVYMYVRRRWRPLCIYICMQTPGGGGGIAVYMHIYAHQAVVATSMYIYACVHQAVVAASSMERRPEPAFDFNEPLLETLLSSGLHPYVKWLRPATIHSNEPLLQTLLSSGLHP